MKIISFNVNGIRAVNKRGNLVDLINLEDPDVLCLQEIKCSDSICEVELVEKYKTMYPYIYYNTSKTRKGYSGTAILTKFKPTSVVYDLVEHDNDEGRIITLVFNTFIILTVYTPNSGSELARHTYRVNDWDVMFKRFVKGLSVRFAKIPLIVCGDLNCAHHDIDIYNPKMSNVAGFTPKERSNFNELLYDSNLVDSFREGHPTEIKYSFWSNLGKSRMKNNGWRIDYFLVSKQYTKNITRANILTDSLGSDHAPIVLEIDL